ncbi:cysteine proteinase [Aaosphaeria arxii CBS 175.79]|uniref:Ubiquitin carboxyl-terminal hydrolase n=1 Tax=Aaosphaeria arxii CBS 175.79 TaxID=1450172 RepID=A0A6A5XS53_9PLEO|nr:cysteine proteinase [Aaosphaeria arxii CBS 175.79]KAF2016165.1 cysteine proteinase [Aaosphaeria arxii CBS 175.79]
MPEKLPTVVAYAAGASLAAATLIYVFGPTYFLDDEGSTTRKKGAIGLSNAANDCFINSILQALAGLPDLRIYLIRETHRRKLDGKEVYEVDPDQLDKDNQKVRPWKLEGLQKGLVTSALKEVLDKLNERPIHRKVISPQPFIRALEHAFSTRISRQQQDAQEFLQIVTERLCDEYHAGGKARRQAQNAGLALVKGDSASERQEIVQQFGAAAVASTENKEQGEAETPEDELPSTEDGFPFEGKIESQIECLTCGFKPKPSVSTFVTLTLNVPQQSSTSLNACFDGIFKVEHIDDFKCEFCRLDHALKFKTQELARASSDDAKETLESDMAKIKQALEQDPETPPEGVELPDAKLAPRRRIARHMYISAFPKVLAVHLSRSMFAAGTVSTKNLAKVAFPEALPLGGLLNRKNYKLRGMVTHKGSHNSGHYESFRRQVHPVPFSTPHSFGVEGVYSMQGSPNPSAVQSPRMSTLNLSSANGHGSPVPSIPTMDSPSLQSLSSHSSQISRGPTPTSTPRDDPQPTSSPSSSSRPKSLRGSIKEKTASVAELPQQMKRKQRQRPNRWWRISDDKIKESKTSDVLKMQKEVYLLFYELDRSPSFLSQ